MGRGPRSLRPSRAPGRVADGRIAEGGPRPQGTNHWFPGARGCKPPARSVTLRSERSQASLQSTRCRQLVCTPSSGPSGCAQGARMKRLQGVPPEFIIGPATTPHIHLNARGVPALSDAVST